MRSLLVVRRGYVVLNEYINGVTPDALQAMQSATTVVTGLTVGVAVREGKLRVTDGAGPLFPEYADLVASGGGGQWIFVVPGKDLVVVATGDANTAATFAKPIQLLYDVIVPAVR